MFSCLFLFPMSSLTLVPSRLWLWDIHFVGFHLNTFQMPHLFASNSHPTASPPTLPPPHALNRSICDYLQGSRSFIFRWFLSFLLVDCLSSLTPLASHTHYNYKLYPRVSTRARLLYLTTARDSFSVSRPLQHPALFSTGSCHSCIFHNHLQNVQLYLCTRLLWFEATVTALWTCYLSINRDPNWHICRKNSGVNIIITLLMNGAPSTSRRIGVVHLP